MKIFVPLIVVLNLTSVIKSEMIFPSCDHKYVLKVLKKILPKNPIIVDAGAYDGTDSIMFSKLWHHVFPEIDNWLKEQGFVLFARDFQLPPAKDCWAGNCLYLRKE